MIERGLASTRSRAQERIDAGQVSIDGVVVTKASTHVEPHQVIATHGVDLPYVSRGGIKLAAALDAWKIEIAGRTCLDVGISSGGFTDCMLQRGATLVIGIDSGHSQLAASLQGEPRLQLLEGTNARYLTPEVLPRGITFIAMDVSFIAASLVLPAVIASAFPAIGKSDATPGHFRKAVILVKPQYEAGREFVGKHGIVKDPVAHQVAIDRVRQTVEANGGKSTQVMDSPIAGGEGNREFLLYARF